MMKRNVYYYINSDVNPDTIYGSEYPVCLPESEIKRLAMEWDRPDLMNDFHVASAQEMQEHGVYFEIHC